MTHRLLLALLLLPTLAAPALAETTVIELTDTVPATTMTYMDWAQVVAPGLKLVNGRYEGVVALPVPSIAYPDEPAVTDLQLGFYSANALEFRSDGVELIALMLDADNPEALGGSVIVVFDPTRPDEIIAVADAATDRMTSFDEQPLLPLSYDEDGLLVSSSHFNSSQGYRVTSLIALMDGKLTEMASVFTLNENDCGMRREQTRAFAPVTTDGDERWGPFTITVTETTRANDCDGNKTVTPGTRAVAATFRWAAETGRYEPDSSALDDLFSETEARF